ncbi:iron ABC transporter permease [Candidatus Bipolaricaulota bacterium]|nr:iron ABC transporter permease [Candidatus Bipolaricaulota bacterium]
MILSKLRATRWLLAGLAIFTAVSLLAGIAIGPVLIPIRRIFASLLGNEAKGLSTIQEIILWQIRSPRVLAGLLVGGGLAVSGATMQGLFRNPLASPYVLGVASGASTGAALAILLAGGVSILLPVGAFAGAAIAVSVVYGLAQSGSHKISVFTLILGGVAVGSFFSAITSFLIFLSSGGERLSDVLFWIMGGLGRANWAALAILAPVVLVSIGAIFFFARDLNALALGEEMAQHVGVNPETLYRWLLVLTTLLTAASVALAGTIGFIGLAIPHVVRLLLGPDHRQLIPASALAGGCFLVWSDLLARTAFAPAELPVGVITAFFGAPFFLYLLKTKGTSL